MVAVFVAGVAVSTAVAVACAVPVTVVAEVAAVAFFVAVASIAAVSVVVAVVALLEGLSHVIYQLLALVVHLLLHLEQPISDFLQNAVVLRLASCIVVFMPMHVIVQVRKTLCSSFYGDFFCIHAVSPILCRVVAFFA